MHTSVCARLQGETLEQQFGEKEVCFRTLDLYTSAVLESSLNPVKPPLSQFRDAMDVMAKVGALPCSCGGSFRLIRGPPGIWPRCLVCCELSGDCCAIKHAAQRVRSSCVLEAVKGQCAGRA